MITNDPTRTGIFKRNAIYYVWYLDQNGNRQHASLKTKLKKEVPQKLEEFKASLLSKSKSDQSLSHFANPFFTTQCPWLRRRIGRGYSIKDITIEMYRRNVEMYIIPGIGSIFMKSLTGRIIENWLLDLDLSNSYKNEILRTLNLILEEACEEGLINRVPKVERFLRQSKKKDTFTTQELEILFPDDPQRLSEIWRGRNLYESPEYSLMFGVLYLLMATTGMRSGEARALKLEHLFLDDYKAISIIQAFDNEGNVGYLKKGSAEDPRFRVALLPDRTIRALKWWQEFQKGEFLFEYNEKPISRRYIEERFGFGLKDAGICIAEKRYTPHSLRYTYNSRMEMILPGDILRQFIGHTDEKMTDYYSRPHLVERLKQLNSNTELVYPSI